MTLGKLMFCMLGLRTGRATCRELWRGLVSFITGSVFLAHDHLTVDKFVESGLMRREYDRVKLHLTLMNTLFRKEQEDLGNTDNDKGQERESFDCRPVLEGWSNLKLGEVKVEEIHLSQRRAGRRTAEGYYLPSSVVRITSCA